MYFGKLALGILCLFFFRRITKLFVWFQAGLVGADGLPLTEEALAQPTDQGSLYPPPPPYPYTTDGQAVVTQQIGPDGQPIVTDQVPAADAGLDPQQVRDLIMFSTKTHLTIQTNWLHLLLFGRHKNDLYWNHNGTVHRRCGL